MFQVIGESRDARTRKIRKIAEVDKAVGLLIAVADFEWTLRRVILLLSPCRTKLLRESLKECHGLDKFKELWKRKVQPTLFPSIGLPMVFDGENDPWQQIVNTYKKRDLLIHGVKGFIRDEEASAAQEAVLVGSNILTDFARARGADVFARINPRSKCGTCPLSKKVRNACPLKG